MYIPVTPIAKPRMTQRDKWAQRPVVVNYRLYKDKLRQAIDAVMVPIEAPMWLVFVLPLPKSYGKKRKLELEDQPHQVKPDIDNLVKGFLDALLEEDSAVYEVHAIKVWGSNPGIYYGEEDYVRISQTIQEPQKRPHAVEEQSEATRRTRRGATRRRGVWMRGVLPGARRR